MAGFGEDCLVLEVTKHQKEEGRVFVQFQVVRVKDVLLSKRSAQSNNGLTDWCLSESFSESFHIYIRYKMETTEPLRKNIQEIERLPLKSKNSIHINIFLKAVLTRNSNPLPFFRARLFSSRKFFKVLFVICYFYFYFQFNVIKMLRTK